MIKTAQTPEEQREARARRAERALQSDKLRLANIAAENARNETEALKRRLAQEQRQKDEDGVAQDSDDLLAMGIGMAAESLLSGLEGIAGGVAAAFSGEGGESAGGGASDGW